MLFPLCLYLALAAASPAPPSWTADTTLGTWCSSQGLSPAQVLQEFAAVDSVVVAEQRYQANHGVYVVCSPWQNFGKTVAEFNAALNVRLPATLLSADTASRIVFAVVSPFDAADTCTTLHATLYSTRSQYNLPAATREDCRESGRSSYRFVTDSGTLIVDGDSHRVTLFDCRVEPTKLVVLFQEAAGSTAPIDSVCSPAATAPCGPR